MQTDNDVMRFLRRGAPAILAFAVATVIYLKVVSSAWSYGRIMAITLGLFLLPILGFVGRALWRWANRRAQHTSPRASRIRSTTQFEWDATAEDFK
jgi:hypothetical protein